MVERGRLLIAALVVTGHALFVLALVQAMRPLPLPAPPESMLMLDLTLLSDPPPAPEPAVEPEPELPATDTAAAPPSPASPPRSRPPREPRAPVPMQAIAIGPDEPAPAQWRLPPAADPFATPPPADAGEQGFGRRERPTLPSPSVPRIAGEVPPNAIIPPQRMNSVGPREVVHAIGAFIGGGPNAPIDVKCGGRLNGGDMVARGFSPGWNRQFGCGEDRDPEAFDGRFEQPPGSVR